MILRVHLLEHILFQYSIGWHGNSAERGLTNAGITRVTVLQRMGSKSMWPMLFGLQCMQMVRLITICHGQQVVSADLSVHAADLNRRLTKNMWETGQPRVLAYRYLLWPATAWKQAAGSWALHTAVIKQWILSPMWTGRFAKADILC